jgi:hypothetical protein
MTGKLGRPEPPAGCSKCQAKNCFWRHGSYIRRVVEAFLSEEIRIERFKCKRCGRTVSVPPVFVIAKRIYSMNLVAERVEYYAKKDTSYRRLANGPDRPPCSSPSQVWRWVNVLSKRAKSILLETQAECTLCEREEELLLRADEAFCLNQQKACTEEKREGLCNLAKAVSFGRVLHDKADCVLFEIGQQYLKKIFGLKQIFAGEPKEKKPPQKATPQMA